MRSPAGLEQGELTAENDLSIRLECDAVHETACLGIETGVEAAIGICPGDHAAGNRVCCPIWLECGELAAEKNLAVWLDREAEDRTIHFRIKSFIETSIRADPGKPVADDRRLRFVRLQSSESATDENPAVRL